MKLCPFNWMWAYDSVFQMAIAYPKALTIEQSNSIIPLLRHTDAFGFWRNRIYTAGGRDIVSTYSLSELDPGSSSSQELFSLYRIKPIAFGKCPRIQCQHTNSGKLGGWVCRSALHCFSKAAEQRCKVHIALKYKPFDDFDITTF